MKKMMIIFAALALVLASCDYNTNIDDLPRTLKISVRQIKNLDGGVYTGTSPNIKSEVVSAAKDSVTDAVTGTVTVNSPKDNYIRKDDVQLTATGGSDYVFAYWLLPSRTDLAIDPVAGGGIRYSEGPTDFTKNVYNLRTDSGTAEIVGAFAKQGTAAAGNFVSFAYPTAGDSGMTYIAGVDNSVKFTITLKRDTTSGDRTIKYPKYRIFDEKGEARTEWLTYAAGSTAVADIGQITVANTKTLVKEHTFAAIADQSQLSKWRVVILYMDPSDDSIFVVK